MRAPSGRVWTAVGGGALALLLGLLLVAWLLARDRPELRAAVAEAERVHPTAPRAVRRAVAEAVQAQEDGRTTDLVLEVVDRDGQAAVDVPLQVRPCHLQMGEDAPWQVLTTDARGEVQTAQVACVELALGHPDWRLVGPEVIALGPPEVLARVEVARRCPGEVEVTRSGQPLPGRVQVYPGGGGALDEQGLLDLPGRLCGPVDAWVAGPGGVGERVEWRVPGLRVDEGWPLRIELEGATPLPERGPWRVRVHIVGGDPPDQVRAFPRRPCEGAGAEWDCPCAGGDACAIDPPPLGSNRHGALQAAEKYGVPPQPIGIARHGERADSFIDGGRRRELKRGR